MTDRNETPTRVSDRALEMVMRDVLDGMLEFSLESAYANGLEFQIIQIGGTQRQAGRDAADGSGPESDAPAADILPFPPLRRAAC
ncbi:MAG TPA: hypothetical protein ENI96_05220 [Sedimenticola thiotaurini]|uniref:Uncharacterized protein n=1 Tax=Sedimenticola thiotaurini TaxID=1543721 RepID=A0A831RJK7_9GAMM|nr:hypothetical protein [Sedimenticola thiotaurini]